MGLSLYIIFLSIGCASPHAYYYSDLIPNGNTVYNPCGASSWLAVSYYDPYHPTHNKNPFGVDLEKAGYEWTQDLCTKDSDGDGQTNGQELGDPFCIWTKGNKAQNPSTGQPGKSYTKSCPGICEPVGSGVCSSLPYRCGCHGHNCIG